jgi:hypothetical protein
LEDGDGGDRVAGAAVEDAVAEAGDGGDQASEQQHPKEAPVAEELDASALNKVKVGAAGEGSQNAIKLDQTLSGKGVLGDFTLDLEGGSDIDFDTDDDSEDSNATDQTAASAPTPARSAVAARVAALMAGAEATPTADTMERRDSSRPQRSSLGKFKSHDQY